MCVLNTSGPWHKEVGKQGANMAAPNSSASTSHKTCAFWSYIRLVSKQLRAIESAACCKSINLKPRPSKASSIYIAPNSGLQPCTGQMLSCFSSSLLLSHHSTRLRMRLLGLAAALITTLCAKVFAASDVCYNPDGSATDSTTYQPCQPSDDVTHCCDTGQSCLSNGLCIVKVRCFSLPTDALIPRH